MQTRNPTEKGLPDILQVICLRDYRQNLTGGGLNVCVNILGADSLPHLTLFARTVFALSRLSWACLALFNFLIRLDMNERRVSMSRVDRSLRGRHALLAVAAANRAPLAESR